MLSCMHISMVKTLVCCLLMICFSAGRYTGSYRIPVFIFLMIFIFKIPQYRYHLNSVRNAATEGSLFTVAFWRGYSLLLSVKVPKLKH